MRPIPPTLQRWTVQFGDFRIPENVRCIFERGRTDAGLKRSTVASFGVVDRPFSRYDAQSRRVYRARIHWVAMAKRKTRRYRFGVFEADTATGELRRQGIRIIGGKCGCQEDLTR